MWSVRKEVNLFVFFRSVECPIDEGIDEGWRVKGVEDSSQFPMDIIKVMILFLVHGRL